MTSAWLLDRLRPPIALPPVETLADWELDLIAHPDRRFVGVVTDRELAAKAERKRRRHREVVDREWDAIQTEGFGL